MNADELLLSFLSASDDAEELLIRLMSEDGVSMPNVRLKVFDGGVFWVTLAERGGWKLEQNTVTGHARILNERGIRVAWGNLEGMREALKRLLRPWEPCKRGDVLAVQRCGGLYSHYAVYTGKGQVVHYAAKNGDFGKGICVHRAEFKAFLKDETSYAILSFPKEYGRPETVNVNLAFLGPLPHYAFQEIPGAREKTGYAQEYHLYTPEQTARRAESRIGETKYNLAVNNCEHFAIWCKTGLKESRQIEKLLGFINETGEYIRKYPYLLLA